MSDFIFVLFLALTILWISPIAQQYEEHMKEEVEDVRAVNAMLWDESTLVVEQLNVCKKRKR